MYKRRNDRPIIVIPVKAELHALLRDIAPLAVYLLVYGLCTGGVRSQPKSLLPEVRTPDYLKHGMCRQTAVVRAE
jgi:hypothetical protein